MAYLHINYFSQALCRQASFEMLIPNDRRDGKTPEQPTKTLFPRRADTDTAANRSPA